MPWDTHCYSIVTKMKTYKIIRTRNRYIVPFEFDIAGNVFEEICEKVDGYRDNPYAFLGRGNSGAECSWERQSLRSGEQDVYDYIIDEFVVPKDSDLSKGIEKAGCYWNYPVFKENPFNLKFSHSFTYDENTAIDIAVQDMGLYLFRSGIGFLWYEIGFDLQKVADSVSFIAFQNIFKELNHRPNHLWIDSLMISLPDELKTEPVFPFMFGNWIAERLAFLNISFQAARKNSYAGAVAELCPKMKNELYKALPERCPDKALIFAYAAFERPEGWEAEEDAKRTAFYLSCGYKESYEIGDRLENKISMPFRNVIWSASKEGCGYFAWAGDDNKRFFSGLFYEKVINDYFLMYIRTIYQSFSLMKYAVYTSQLLPNDSKVYTVVSEDSEKLSDRISEICTKINLFLVKSVATSVSHVQQQNDFYNFVCNRIRIKEDVKSVTAGMAGLNELQKESIRQKKEELARQNRTERMVEEKRQREAGNRFQIGLGLLTILATLSAVADGYSFIAGFSAGNLSGHKVLALAVVGVICATVFCASLYYFLRAQKTLKKDKER